MALELRHLERGGHGIAWIGARARQDYRTVYRLHYPTGERTLDIGMRGAAMLPFTFILFLFFFPFDSVIDTNDDVATKFPKKLCSEVGEINRGSSLLARESCIYDQLGSAKLFF